MQPYSRDMRAMGSQMNRFSRSSDTSQMTLREFHNGTGHSQIQNPNPAQDDFFDHMLSTIPSWPDLVKSPWELCTGDGKPVARDDALHFTPPYDESSFLASRLRQYQISGGGGGSAAGKPMMLPCVTQQQHHQLLLSAMGGHQQPSGSAADSGHHSALPLSLEAGGDGAGNDASLKSSNSTGGEGLYNGFHQHAPQAQVASALQQSFRGTVPQPTTAATGGPPRQRVRARRGQATDPHSIAERLRRERIAERMKALQELVPNANKTDKASMLDEIIDYVKFLQLQVKILSMSRLGGAAAIAPLVPGISSEEAVARGSTSPAAEASENIASAEHQVAKLMEEDMGAAMQYLQGKGLCLMPITLASAISTASCRSPAVGSAGGFPAAGAGNHLFGLINGPPAGGDPPSSPSMSVLTVQSAVGGGDADVSRSSGMDSASVSKP